jgi:hypothetical protein
MTPLASSVIPLSIPGLNTRETAIVLWFGAFLLLALAKSDIRRSIGDLLKLIVTSAWIAGTLLGTVAYVTASILFLIYAGYWDTGMTKASILWFVGFALVTLVNTQDVDRAYFYRLLLHNLALAAVVEFIANLHTFPLPIELALVPMAFLLTVTQLVADSNPEFAPARKLIAWCVGLLGGASLVFSLMYLGEHFDEVATAGKVKEFLLPLVLTACFIPFLIGVRYLSVWQMMLTKIRLGLHDNDELYRFARRLIVRACGVNLLKTQLFASKVRGRLWGATSESEVTRVVEDFQKTWSREHRRAA